MRKHGQSSYTGGNRLIRLRKIAALEERIDSLAAMVSMVTKGKATYKEDQGENSLADQWREQ